MTMSRKATVYFYRDYQGFTGGHLKVWDYFQHIKSCDQFKADIYFTPQSTWVDNPWRENKDKCLQIWNPEQADILFLAGLDWLALSEEQRRSPPSPVINLIQSVRHADKSNPLYGFLKFPATRICVSREVADAINNTGVVNGPVVVNTNGIDHSILPEMKAQNEKDIPLFIVGNKNPELANKLAGHLSLDGITSHVFIDQVLRDEFLTLINRAKVVLFLPVRNEGFYLPALEAMCLSSFVVCPDCIGNRSFCIDGRTCLRPDYEFGQIYKAVKQALNLQENQRKLIIDNASFLAKSFTLGRERDVFLNILSKY